MKIAIDLKNPALYGGGISHWVLGFLPTWIKNFSRDHFSIISPVGRDLKAVDIPGSVMHHCAWPSMLPRQLRHPIYDNWIFPQAISKVKPDLIFSPYFDVRMPKDIPSIITIHDLCFIEVGHLYPSHLKNYYLYMMRLNLARACHVVTVSETTRKQLVDILGVKEENISVIPNALEEAFLSEKPSLDQARKWRQKIDVKDDVRLLLYPGGIEYRKNIPGLMSALGKLWSEGHQITLLITGQPNEEFLQNFQQTNANLNSVKFLGRLSQTELRLAYSSVDAVVYPTFSEGFGRVCLEAMGSGTPLACSDLNVLREVAGDYPIYFNPKNKDEIANSILKAIKQGPQPIVLKEEFTSASVREKFLSEISKVMDKVKAYPHLKGVFGK
jgi:glycosyltransferase involved in cell wall biosynthesis